MVQVVIGVPVKPFGVAKGRLAAVLDPDERARLGRALAERTVAAVAAAGAHPLVLSADDVVTEWARSMGVAVLLDEGSSLNEAATAAVSWAHARGSVWAILHADVPTIDADDLVPATEILAEGGAVVAPSSDGGTSLVGASVDRYSFAYGAGSFHRHLARLARHDPVVLVRRGLALDLDTPDDLAAAARTADGAWLRQ